MRNLHDPRLPETIREALQSEGVSSDLLRVEVTETAIMADPVGTLDVLGRLRDQGVRIAIDDFGTGYSSLTYLKRLPVDEIKIDKSFVREVIRNPNDAVIVRAAIDLGHNLGLDVVAEGAEDEATWDRLAALGCDIVQGYYPTPPLTADVLRPWIDRWRRIQEERVASPSTRVIMSALSQVDLFRRLPPEGLSRLGKLGRLRAYSSGEVLLRRGDVSDSLHIIKHGRVQVERPHASGGVAIPLAELGAGGVIGEMGALDSEPRSATVIALEETETVELSATALAVAVLQYPQIAGALLGLLSRRLRAVDELVDLLIARAGVEGAGAEAGRR